ncbi:MAG: hypothetical protein ABII71_06490 [Candidatus Micrarchaeota archaeon]
MAGAEPPQMKKSSQQAQMQTPKADFRKRQFDLTKTLSGLLGRLSSAGMLEGMSIRREVKSMMPQDIEGYKEFGRALVATGSSEALTFLKGSGPKGICPNFKRFQLAKLATTETLSPRERLAVEREISKSLKGTDSETSQKVISFMNKRSIEMGLSITFKPGSSGGISHEVAGGNAGESVRQLNPAPIIYPNLASSRSGSLLSTDLSPFVAAREAIFKVHAETRDQGHLRRALTLWPARQMEPEVPIMPRHVEEGGQNLEPGPEYFMAPAPAAPRKDSAPFQAGARVEPVSAGISDSRLPEPETPRVRFFESRPLEIRKAVPQKDAPLPPQQRICVPTPRKSRKNGGDGMIRDIAPVKITGRTVSMNSEAVSPLLAASERGEEIIRRLMEKMESHGRHKHHVRPRASEEKPKEKKTAEKPPGEAAAKKQKPAKPAKKKARKAAAKPSSKKKGKKAKKKMPTEKKKADKKKSAKDAVKQAVAKPKTTKKAARKTANKAASEKPVKKPVKGPARKKSKSQVVKELLLKRKRKK